MLIDAAKHGWARTAIPDVTVTGSLTHTFASPVMLYRFTGEGNIKVSVDEATVLYEGPLPYDLPEPVTCDSLIFETAVLSTETAEDGTVTNTYATVTVGFLGLTGSALVKISDYLNTSAGMTSVAGNVDDSVYTVATGITGFKFNGAEVSNLYVSTNHFVGFGSNAEHLQIFRRDGRSTAIYSQTVTDGVPFVKIRFEGYTVYNNQVTANRLIYELFVISNGDMFLNIIQAPTTSGTYGSSALICNGATTPLTTPANGTTGTLISFYRADEEGKSWTIAYETYEGTSDDTPLYLALVDGKYYAAQDGALVEKPVTELTALAFLEHGGDVLPSTALIPVNPKIYAWTAAHAAKLKWIAKAHPLPQELKCTADMNNDSITGIQQLTAEYSGTVLLSHRTTGEWSEAVDLGQWITRDCDELYASVGEAKLLFLRFHLYGGKLRRFKITYKN